MQDKLTRRIRIVREPDGETIAEGEIGLWGITPFATNYYITRRFLKTFGFRST